MSHIQALTYESKKIMRLTNKKTWQKTYVVKERGALKLLLQRSDW